MSNEEIIRRLRSLISLFDDDEDEESITHFKKAILGKLHQSVVDDLPALFDFLETAIADSFINFEAGERELFNCESDLEESKEECNRLSQENARLKKQLAKRDR